ncbi:MAG: S46 family peptidase [Bacteroidetes bacterium]|nr:S46 family peptidase [Bacteroidota bacterium]
MCKSWKNNIKRHTHYEATVRAFFYGNEFYLFLTETFKDIRLVGAPPSSVGNFGARRTTGFGRDI